MDPSSRARVTTQEALAKSPPEWQGDIREPDRVEPVTFAAAIRLDVRYATTNNFMRSVFYDEPRAFLQRDGDKYPILNRTFDELTR